ncbi:hypothetical protein DSECCO2_558850 [anaerobic digester metagenome]
MGGEAARPFHQRGEPFVLTYLGILPAKQHLAADGHVLLHLVARGAAHHHLVVGLQRETGIARHDLPVGQGESEPFTGLFRHGGAGGVLEAAVDIDAGGGGGFRQSAGTQDNVFDRHVLGIGIAVGMAHFSSDIDGEVALEREHRGDVQQVVLPQFDIGDLPTEQRVQTERLHGAGEVFVLAVEQCPLQVSVAGGALGHLDQVAHGADLLTDSVLSGAIDRSGYLHHVGVFVQDSAHLGTVAILEPESTVLRLTEGVGFHLFTPLTEHGDVAAVGVSAVAARIADEVFQRFALFQFVPHGALHLTNGLRQNAVGFHHHDVAFLQGDVGHVVPFHQVLVEVDRSDGLARTEEPYVADAPDAAGATGGIEGMESGGERAEGIGAGPLHLAHHVDLDAPHVADGDGQESVGLAGAEVGIDGGKFILDFQFCLFHA